MIIEIIEYIDLILGWTCWIVVLIPLVLYAYTCAFINKLFEKNETA